MKSFNPIRAHLQAEQKRTRKLWISQEILCYPLYYSSWLTKGASTYYVTDKGRGELTALLR